MENYIKRQLNINDRLEAAGWLEPPSAKLFYNQHLTDKFSSYDLYVEDSYNRVLKSKWAGRVGVVEPAQPAKTQEFDRISDLELEPSLTPQEPLESSYNENNTFIEDFNSPIKSPAPYSPPINANNPPEVVKLKIKRNKNHNNSKINHNECPYCLSKLEVNEFSIIECTGDKLKYWEEVFPKYKAMTPENQKLHLKNYSDSSIFLDLYERWERNGNKLDCLYSNRLGNPISKLRTTLPDPCLTSTIERSLGRPMTEEEKRGEVEIWQEGKAYFDDFKEGRRKVKVPQIVYPDGLL